MTKAYNELDELAKQEKPSQVAIFETDIGTFKFCWREKKKSKDLFNIYYKANELAGFFNNGAMLLSDVKKLLRSHNGVFSKMEG